jgi:uncharacterized membrane protein YdjX (TVP38/TMEM64 family)
MSRPSRPSRLRESLTLAAVAAVVAAALLLSRHYEAPLRRFIADHSVAGIVLYLLLNILDAMVAPGATLALIPIVAKQWGRIPAALVTTAGWTIGSLLAFLVARRWGAAVVKKLTSYDRVRRAAKHIPDNLFWSVVALRLVMPMDVISYVLGLFTSMSWQAYVGATLLGLTPSALVLAFLGKEPHAYRVLTIVVFAATGVALVIAARRRPARAH